MKNTELKFRVEDDLKRGFLVACQAQGTSTAAMLRGYMAAYVEAAVRLDGALFDIRIEARERVATKKPATKKAAALEGQATKKRRVKK